MGDVISMLLGLNIGYSYVKCAYGSGNTIKHVGFPSLVGSYDMASFAFLEKQIIALESEQVLVGDAAVVQSESDFRTENREWVLNDVWKQLMYAAISEVTAATRVDITIVTGLPISFYADKDLLRSARRGEHTFKRAGRSKQNINITEFRVVPEPFGALFDEAFNANGTTKSDLLERKVGVIDVGSKKINFQSVSAMEPLETESGTIDYGIWNMVRAVQRWIGDTMPELTLRDHQVMQAITNGYVQYYGEKVDISDRVKTYSTHLCKSIEAALSRFWRDNKGSFDTIILTGGGSRLVKDMVLDMFKQAHVAQDPIFANANGMYKFAKYIEQQG